MPDTTMPDNEKAGEHNGAKVDAAAVIGTITGTTGGANPASGSADAARGVGGHSKDAGHDPGQPAQKVQSGKA